MLSAMGCEKFQRMPGILLSCVSIAEISSSLSLWKTGRHLFFRLEVHEIFGVEEAGGVCAVVGAADLAGYQGDFGKRGEDVAGLVGDADAFGGAGAGGQGAADPDGAFVEVGEEFGANHAADHQENGEGESGGADC